MLPYMFALRNIPGVKNILLLEIVKTSARHLQPEIIVLRRKLRGNDTLLTSKIKEVSALNYRWRCCCKYLK